MASNSIPAQQYWGDSWWQQQQMQQQQPVYSTDNVYGHYYTSSGGQQQQQPSRNELASHVVDGLEEMNRAINDSTTTVMSSPTTSTDRTKKMLDIFTILRHQDVTSICRVRKSSTSSSAAAATSNSEQFIQFLNKSGQDQKVTRIGKSVALFYNKNFFDSPFNFHKNFF